MRDLVFVAPNGTKVTTKKDKVKGVEYTTELEPVKEVETPEMRELRLQRIAKAQKNIVKAYAEYKSNPANEDVKETLYGVQVKKYKPEEKAEATA